MTDPQWKPAQEWTAEVGHGVVRLTRTRPEVRWLAESSSVHIHYWQTDEEMDAQGWAMTDLVCHGCNTGTRFIYSTVTLEQAAREPMRPMREAFVHDHRSHFALGHEALCPPHYLITETRDLRESAGGVG